MVFHNILFRITSQYYHRKGISCVYKYDQRNWPFPSTNTTFFIPPCFDISIQTKRNSALDASAGANDVATDVLYQSTNHHVNTNGNNIDDSQSFEIPRKNNFPSSFFGDTISTTTIPRSSTLPPSGKLYLCFQI